MKKHTKVAIEEMQKNQKLGIKKITLRDLDEPELDNVAGGTSIQPTTTVQPTHQIKCITTGVEVL
ncbi:MAG: hypothetical protein WCA49_05195 [Candidatus Sulfotelmatobacter sp.]